MTTDHIVQIVLNLIAAIIFVIIFERSVGRFRDWAFSWILSLNKTVESAFYRRVAQRKGAHSVVIVGIFSVMLLALLIAAQFPRFGPIPERLTAVALMIEFVAVLVFMIEAIITSNALAAVSIYEQVRAIVRPYIDDVSLYRFDSEFALILSKENYMDIVARLAAIGALNAGFPPAIEAAIRRILKENQKRLPEA